MQCGSAQHSLTCIAPARPPIHQKPRCLPPPEGVPGGQGGDAEEKQAGPTKAPLVDARNPAVGESAGIRSPGTASSGPSSPRHGVSPPSHEASSVASGGGGARREVAISGPELLSELECLERAAALLQRANLVACEFNQAAESAHRLVSAGLEAASADPPGRADPRKTAAFEAADDLILMAQRKALERMRKVLALRKQVCELARDSRGGGSSPRPRDPLRVPSSPGAPSPSFSDPWRGCSWSAPLAASRPGPASLPPEGEPLASARPIECPAPVPLFGGIGPQMSVWQGVPPPVDGSGLACAAPSWAPQTPRKL